MTSAMDVVECTTNIQTPFENDISPTRPKEPIEYMTIREVLEKFNRREPLPKVNIFGVVTYLPSEVKAIEKKDTVSQVTIVDDTCEANDRLKLNVFSPPNEPLIRDACQIGDIVRFHRIRVQEYRGNPQGVHVAKMSSWIRFKRVPPPTTKQPTPSPTKKTRTSSSSPKKQCAPAAATTPTRRMSPRLLASSPSTAGKRASPRRTSPSAAAAASAQEQDEPMNEETDDRFDLDPIEFEFVSNRHNNTLEEQDKKFVRKLRKWLSTNPQVVSLIEAGLSTPTNDFNIPTMLQSNVNQATTSNIAAAANLQTSPTRQCRLFTFGSILRDGYYDVVCQVCALGEFKATRFLIVWDGTKSTQSFYQENQFKVDKEQALYSSELLSYLYQVFVFDEFLFHVDALKPGDFVLLKNMCVKSLTSGTHVDLVMKMPGYGGSAARYGRTITKLAQPSSHAGTASENPEIDRRIREISQKGKELKIRQISAAEFVSEYCKIDQSDSMNSTLNELIQQNNAAAQRGGVRTILSQVNRLLEDDDSAYNNSSQQQKQQQKSPSKSISPSKRKRPEDEIQIETCDEEILKLKRLVKLTYLVPFICLPERPLEMLIEPYFYSLAHLAQEAAKNRQIRCKVIAKLYNYSISSSPAIASVFVSCRHCSYVNFVPFHLANIYQSSSLNMILRQSQSSTQQTTEDEDEETNNEEEDEDQYKKRLSRNFSLEWLKTAMPMNTQSMAATQAATSRHNSEQTAYEYACPRCELQHNDLRPLSYIYRFWLVLRDATSQLDPCLLEADSAYRMLDRVEPLKFFANAAKSHAVYKTIHSALNRKYLFTIETFRLPDNIHGNNGKKLDVLFKIADMTEIVSN